MDIATLAEKNKWEKEKEQKVDELVDQLLELLEHPDAPKIEKLVTHKFPDDDSLLCLWMAKKFIPRTSKAEIVFVNAGESLPDSAEDPAILHFDTGNTEFDHHSNGNYQTCSAALLAEKLGKQDDPGIAPLFEMATAVDNVQAIPYTSIHFIIEGLPRECKKTDNSVDWTTVIQEVFRMFNIVYGQAVSRAKAIESYKEHAQRTSLANGIKACFLPGIPQSRNAAFEDGAHVVIWTQHRKDPEDKSQMLLYVGIQINRRYPNLLLDYVAAALRLVETTKRKIAVKGRLDYTGEGNSWFLHPSKRLILHGSRTSVPAKEIRTLLTPTEIPGIVYNVLRKIPAKTVSGF